MAQINLKIENLTSSWSESFSFFLKQLKNQNVDKYFHPHSFDSETAYKLSTYEGEDYYCVVAIEKKIIGYGMLRGWDEGYFIPSLGIAILAEYRKKQFSTLLLQFLHIVARMKKAEKIRLTVYKNNHAAVKLYKSFGYKFSKLDDKRLLGLIDIK